MKHQIVVQAMWDDEAQVWVASTNDLPGLAVEADTLERLTAQVLLAIEGLIQLNGLESDLHEIPVRIRSEQSASVLVPCH